MTQFSTAWFDDNIEHWKKELDVFRGQQSLRFLEIGCFEGRATRWLLENILTDPASIIHVVDTFEGSPEHANEDYADALPDLLNTFKHNISEYQSKVIIHQGRSHDILPQFQGMEESFDFIYIDGSHHQDDVYLDAQLSWGLLKTGGIMAFDDYKWEWKDPVSGELQAPRIGIDRWLREHAGEFSLIHRKWQLHLIKRQTNLLERTIRTVRWSALLSKFPIRKSQILRRLRKYGLVT